LREEVFGPVLHVVRYRAEQLDRLLGDIAASEYGLTLGIQSRIDSTVRHIVERLSTGNIYVNRNIIGAVVGTQPFGGSGLSGTGPKAGGPSYLRRFTLEQVVTVNTTAVGGNASLLAEQS
jgi:RHH-type proline utilization regulon transcriptional repressor/proline dehydrogenase/delta 1-pyrroline-5-carboxylate dehydrogenase